MLAAGRELGQIACLRFRLLDQLHAWAVQLIKAARPMRRPGRRRSPQISRLADRARRRKVPYRNRVGRRESRPLRAHEARRISRRLAHPARQDRHGIAELNLRDPVMYRIRHASASPYWRQVVHLPHVRLPRMASPTRWSRSRIPSARWELKDHRPLYNWFIQQLGIFPSQQIEFDRLN